MVTVQRAVSAALPDLFDEADAGDLTDGDRTDGDLVDGDLAAYDRTDRAMTNGGLRADVDLRTDLVGSRR